MAESESSIKVCVKTQKQKYEINSSPLATIKEVCRSFDANGLIPTMYVKALTAVAKLLVYHKRSYCLSNIITVVDVDRIGKLTSNGCKNDFILNNARSFLQFKEVLSKELNVEIGGLCLIFAGRILKDAETLKSYGIMMVIKLT